ncbi:hypothetical protein CC80DRAFT_415698 [Byssothecium circinans]|uniref:Uncharacterized protein n=1 Tax=Byssothecium circinans TaxID=147558 RepID=A0A6A5TTW7_9PLEO|nr:hypothetical protein CC80DRAFT_415698 [Byssothecium circinans]
MVLDLLALTAIPTAVGASEAVHQQRILDEEAESEERQAPFYLDVFCDAKSRKRDEVHGAMVVLRDGKLWLWPKDPDTNLPKEDPDGGPPPHPFTGFYLPFPTQDLPHRPIPAPPILGLVSTIPPTHHSPSPSKSSKRRKLKLNWIYADRKTRELRYGPRAEARHHIIGPWDWTEDDEQGLTLNDEECMVAVEEESGGYGWAVYWDRDDDRLKAFGVEKEKRVLRCSLERRLVEEGRRVIEVE